MTMHVLRRIRRAALTALFLLPPLAGCSLSKEAQLAAVAKDWCMTIRASQVVPVYPMTEDLQPGDIFLVQTPIDEQAKQYEADGFLPLDQHLARIEPLLFDPFYDGSFGISKDGHTPHQWQFPPQGVVNPADGAAKPGPDGKVSSDPKADGKDPSGVLPTTGWANAPLAAFPTYTFSVERGGGLSLAVPVHGVPVALGIMGSSSASGSIAISDAYTYGIDIASLAKQVEEWSAAHKELLSNYPPDPSAGEDGYFYIRIVYRVYLAGKVDINLNDDEAYAASLSGGAKKDVEILTPAAGAAQKNFQSAIDSLGKGVDSALPGGTLKLTGASSRSVSLVETFRRPLVIGYLGFDAPILKDGAIGSFEPTRARLLKRKHVKLDRSTPAKYGADKNTARIRNWLRSDAKNRDLLAKWLKDHKGFAETMIAPVENAEKYAELRTEIVASLNIP